ncbi:NAD-dependent epimerase/dehydratase family protein [Arthrobacter castelli]|uniref:NAD-dependent epimerase/dehydratase family protein n=1 Tax=Arthrobacter castelli TaxID=271431 RepID=UPI00047B36A4|nr:NAD-dependent epimerase/dehydratase family protein [Arthrobacter castelli]
MNILVTGASGMLGRAVAEALIARSAKLGRRDRVYTFQRGASSIEGAQDRRGSLGDPGAVERAVDGIDAVIHLAAKVSFAGEAEEFDDVNIEGTRRLLTAARQAGVSDVVFVSSPSVAHHGWSIVGDGAGPASPEHARGNYARTKAAAELLALGMDSPGFRVAAVRPHIVWGPGDTQLVERVVARAKSGRLPLLDSGAALIDTTYVDNAASAITAALNRMDHAHGRALVVTNGEPRPVGELIAGICAAGGAPTPTRHIPGWLARAAGSVIERVWTVAPGEDEPPMTRFLAEQLSTAHWFDQRQTRQVLDWTPEVSIDEGLSRLAAHYGGRASG